MLWLLAGMLALGLLVALASSPFLCALGIALSLYTGLLTAIPVGFTLKAPQLLALVGAAAYLFRFLATGGCNRFALTYGFPFLLFFMAILPSLFNTDIHQLYLKETQSSLRLLFNYLFVQLMAFILLAAASDKVRLRWLIWLSFLSCLLSLAFGYYQQIGYYLNFYDPRRYMGIHSTFVDTYGPFLRLSPGTFANEYGQILQTTGILAAGYLFLEGGQLLRGWKKTALMAFLGLILFSLLINFTRASWIVFGVGVFLILLLARLPWYLSMLWLLLSAGVISVLSYISQWLAALDALQAIGQRVSELSDITAFSAGQRLLYWQDAWLAFLEHPWIGNGWGQYVVTHNVPLQLLAETGLLGFSAYYLLMVWVVWQMWRGWRAARDPELRSLQISLLIAFLGCLAFDLTNHGLLHFVFWFTMALGLAAAKLNLSGECGIRRS